jgi:hypothetical protein
MRAVPMGDFDLWKLSTEYSVAHAALIIAGHSPENTLDHNESGLDRNFPDFLAVKTAICSAIRSGKLKPVSVVYYEDSYGNEEHLNIFETLVSVSELSRFLKTRGATTDFFDRPEFEGSHQFDASSPYFPKKLGAANKAWVAVTSDPALLAGKSPKQALKKWLTENAASLGLLNKNGAPNHTGIDEICKVANWKPEGGATPTHLVEPLPAPPSLVRLPSSSEAESNSFLGPDDEIPF